MEQNPYESPQPIAPDPPDTETLREIVITVTTITVAGVIPAWLLWFVYMPR
jgi:hypothetical protein